jgi:hypothetical protein
MFFFGLFPNALLADLHSSVTGLLESVTSIPMLLDVTANVPPVLNPDTLPLSTSEID